VTPFAPIQMALTMSDSQSRSDDAILQQVPSMCDLLGLKRFAPKKLIWKDDIYLGEGGRMPVPVDYVFVGGRQMILAKRMQGVLSPEEWRPVIGSTLLVRSWATPRVIKSLMAGVILALAYYVPVLLLAFETTLLGSARVVLTSPIFPLLMGAITFVVIGRVYSPEAHKEALRADLRVAGLVGRDRFLATLQKIESMGFEEVEKLNRKRSMFKQPSIQERIQNLQSGGNIPLATQ
jgi:hypothetical protein